MEYRMVLMTGVIAVLSLIGAEAWAQDCGCDHRVEAGDLTVNGGDLGVQPGDRVCVIAGEREFLRLQNIVGTAAAPVEVINCGGQVVIHNETRAYALVVEESSSNFRITGTGDPNVEYGFKISAPAREPYPGVGLWLLGKSTDYEVDHMEIFDTGFAGVSAKTDPLCDGSADQDVFVQRNSKFHHLHIHDTGGEGFYIGSTQSNGQTITCDGAQEVHQPHFLENVEVHDNIIENTGWDGAQIGMARSGCRFYRNVIRNVGLEGVQYQQQGLQIGTFSSCDIFSNVLETGPTNGVFVLEAGPTRVFNNVVRGFDGSCIYANDRDRGTGSYEFYFNALAECGDGALKIFGNDITGNVARNNVVYASVAGIAAGNEVDWTESNNLDFAMVADAMVDAQFLPAEGSPLLGAGVAVAGIDADLRGVARPDPPAVGPYEYLVPGEEPPDSGFVPDPLEPGESDMGVPANPGTDMGAAGSVGDMGQPGTSDMAGSDSSGSSESSDGCCSTSATVSGSGALFWVLLGFGWFRRRKISMLKSS